MINSPDLRVVASGDLDRARGTAPWSAVLDPWIAPEENHNNLNDIRQIAGSVWFERSDGVPTGSHACRWTPANGGQPSGAHPL